MTTPWSRPTPSATASRPAWSPTICAAPLTFVDRIEAGVVKVNEPTTGLALQAPFGGFKHSSANTFKEQGPAAVEFYTRTKTVYVTYG